MSLRSRCDANRYCMLVIPTHVMSWPNLSITYEFLTKLQGQMCAQGYLSRWSRMYFNYCHPHVMSWPNLSITCELLTMLRGPLCAQRYLSRLSHQWLACLYQPDVMLIAIVC